MYVFKTHPLLKHQEHRPWPVPRRPWIMAQTWNNLLFAHWPLPPDAIRPLLPPELPLDTFDGQAWVGVVPFHVSRLRPRGVIPLPLLSNFPELNVRTYVTIENKPGVWFFSLDAAHRLGVEAARRFYHLAYFYARMHWHLEGQTVHYNSTRADHRLGPGEFRGTYRSTSDVYFSTPGTLEHWLTERYCLYAAKGDRLYRGDIHHLPWPLQKAEANFEVNTVAQAHGIQLPDVPPLLHYAERLDMLAWYVEKVKR